MILYLSGPISGSLFYGLTFGASSFCLGVGKGHTILNPANLPKGLKDYEDYMRIGFAMIDAADAIVMLDGWKNSEGAKRELKYAILHRKKVYFGADSVPAKRDRRTVP